jgi:hypothetical protein
MRRNWFVAATVVIYLGADIAISLTRGGWLPQSIATGAILASFLLFAWRFRDRVMIRYVLFGLVAGFCELPIDAWMADHTKTLIYPTGEPMIWASPAYMPFGWAVVLVQICTLGDWASDRLHVVKASLLVVVFSGFYIPIYEHLAKDGNLWWYVKTPMIFNAPRYIIVAELMLAIPLVWMGLQAERLGRWWWIVLLGVVEGLVVMSVAVWIAFALVG